MAARGEGARAPRRTPRQENAGDYRELRALLEGLQDRVAETRQDAREARDAALALTERFGAQDVPAQVVELRNQVDAGFAAARSDLVNAMTKMTGEMRTGHDNHEARILALEGFRNRVEGAGGLVTWLSKNAPWLVTAVFAGLAVLGFKDKLP